MKLNHNELLSYPNKHDQIIFASAKQAWDMGAVGVEALLALRGAGSDTMIIADWFSCREQIAQTTGRTGAAVLCGAGLIM